MTTKNVYLHHTTDGEHCYYATKAEAIAAAKSQGGDVTLEKIGTSAQILCDILNQRGGYVFGSRDIAKFDAPVAAE